MYSCDIHIWPEAQGWVAEAATQVDGLPRHFRTVRLDSPEACMEILAQVMRENLGEPAHCEHLEIHEQAYEGRDLELDEAFEGPDAD